MSNWKSDTTAAKCGEYYVRIIEIINKMQNGAIYESFLTNNFYSTNDPFLWHHKN